jgi:hypothetical protein
METRVLRSKNSNLYGMVRVMSNEDKYVSLIPAEESFLGMGKYLA